MNLLSPETISFPQRTKKMFFFYPNQKDKVLRRTKRRLFSPKKWPVSFFFPAWIKENDPCWTECKKYCLNQAARGASSWGSGRLLPPLALF